MCGGGVAGGEAERRLVPAGPRTAEVCPGVPLSGLRQPGVWCPTGLRELERDLAEMSSVTRPRPPV